jgi:uncharacterized protein YndB with AHSA1/START domain
MPTEDLVIKRIINAPVELVWKAWTEPQHVMQWWGPQHYTSPSCRIDLCEGGSYLFCMRAPKEQGGQDAYNAGVYTKIVPHQTLEFTSFLADIEGNAIDPTAIGMPADFPKEILYNLTFRKLGELTELTIVEHNWPMTQMRVFSYAGMHQSLDKFADAFSVA